jgi:hypothetical protein
MNKFLFDGENRLFICKPGVTSVDIQVDLYSAYKQEVLLGTIRSGPKQSGLLVVILSAEEFM